MKKIIIIFVFSLLLFCNGCASNQEDDQMYYYDSLNSIKDKIHSIDSLENFTFYMVELMIQVDRSSSSYYHSNVLKANYAIKILENDGTESVTLMFFYEFESIDTETPIVIIEFYPVTIDLEVESPEITYSSSRETEIYAFYGDDYGDKNYYIYDFSKAACNIMGNTDDARDANFNGEFYLNNILIARVGFIFESQFEVPELAFFRTGIINLIEESLNVLL